MANSSLKQHDLSKKIKKFLVSHAYFNKLAKLYQQTFLSDQLVILNYHLIVNSPLEVSDWCALELEQFCQQLNYLRKNFTILPLAQAIEKCQNNALNKPTIVLTFDDGFQNIYDLVFPLLVEFEIPVSIFVTTSFTDTHNTIWPFQLNDALQRCQSDFFFLLTG